jgi:hypothetical protein
VEHDNRISGSNNETTRGASRAGHGNDISDGDSPLITLRYVPWRIVWRFFIPYSIIFPIFFMIVFYWAPKKQEVFFPLFFQIVCTIGLLGMLWLIIDMLLTKDLQLHMDRVVKNYRIFGPLEIPIHEGIFSVRTYLWGESIVVNSPKKMRFLGQIQFDCNLSDKGCLERCPSVQELNSQTRLGEW